MWHDLLELGAAAAVGIYSPFVLNEYCRPSDHPSSSYFFPSGRAFTSHWPYFFSSRKQAFLREVSDCRFPREPSPYPRRLLCASRVSAISTGIAYVPVLRRECTCTYAHFRRLTRKFARRRAQLVFRNFDFGVGVKDRQDGASSGAQAVRCNFAPG